MSEPSLRPASWRRRRSAHGDHALAGGLTAFTFFTVVTLAITWPLPLRLATSVPGDYGDPLFIMWAMSWVADRLLEAVTDPLSLRRLWDAPAFVPEPTALAFSDHFIPQTVMVLPVYWLTGNAILCYNLAFLASFVLTGTTTALLARALTGSLAAALLAGVVASFNELRLVWEAARLQVLSVYWFPLVLLGIHKYLTTGRRRALVGTAAAWVALNLSSVYYLAYCAPMIAAFAVVELLNRRKWGDVVVWRDLLSTVVITGLLTAPFLWPYLEIQRRYDFARTAQEVITGSATIAAYRNALSRLVVPLTLSALAVAMTVTARLRKGSGAHAWTSPASIGLVAGLLLLTTATVWLSLGPVVRIDVAPAGVPPLYPTVAWLPGYSGLRVPSRFASLFLILLGVLAAFGAVAIGRESRRTVAVIALLATTLFLWQARGLRTQIDQPLPSAGLAAAPRYLTPAPRLPAIYQAIANLPHDTVIAEFPFGDPWYDVRYMFFAARHHRPLLNGYSGVFPPSYVERRARLARPFRDPDRAWQSVSQAAYAVVHSAAWDDDTGVQVEAWLAEHGAVLVGRFDGASLYRLREPGGLGPGTRAMDATSDGPLNPAPPTRRGSS